MVEELNRAALTGDIDAFYRALEKEPGILTFIEKKLDFAETPLHVASKHGKTDLAVEISSLQPSFGKKLNPSGHSPLDLALRNGQRETVKQLIKFAPELIGVGSRERKSPLHYVAETNDYDLLAEFLVACPTAAKGLTIRGETALHLAILTGSMKSFKVLMGWMSRTDNKKMLRWKDKNGNTALHVAAQTSRVAVIKRLIKEKSIDLQDRNEAYETALDIVLKRISSHECKEKNNNNIDNAADLHIIEDNITNQEDSEIQKLLHKAGARKSSELSILNLSMADVLSSEKYSPTSNVARARVDLDKGVTNEARNAFLVVTVLILTATFQAVLSPPGGGFHKTDNFLAASPTPSPTSHINHNTGKSIRYSEILKEILFLAFIAVNSFTFTASLGLTFLLMPFECYRNRLIPTTLLCLLLSYLLCFIIMLNTIDIFVTVGILCFGFIIFFLVVAKTLFIPRGLNSTMKASIYEIEQQVRLGKYMTFDD